MSPQSRPRDGLLNARFAQRALALIGALGVVVATLLAFPIAASAAPNGAIVVDNVVLSHEGDGQLTIGDEMTLTGEWDATAANPQAGDTFTITLPEELGFDASVTFDLVGENAVGESLAWGTCAIDASSGIVTCTLSEAAELHDEVSGTFEFFVKATKATESNELVFDLNGQGTPVRVPGDAGIDDGIVITDEWGKFGSLNGDKWSMDWRIELPGSALAANVGAAGVVNVFERTSGNHALCDPERGFRMETKRGDAVADVTDLLAVSTEVPGDYDFAWQITEPEAGFDPNVTYMITYTTCTPDEQIDPKGTTYTNEAVVDIFGNDSSGVIGVEQDWEPSFTVAKWGSVRGGADRNGLIDWSVAVAGSFLEGKTNVSFTDELDGHHAICGDDIPSFTVHEKYGPSWAKSTNITDKLDITGTVDADKLGFDVTITPKDGFAFTGDNNEYVIQYQTCATTDGLPEGGEVFGNSATVDGELAGTTATTPDRAAGKGGSINGSNVEIDGETYLPQTTLDWNIRIPGERLVDLDSALTITDTISGTHQVCGDGDGDVTERIRLTVQARDQINNGGLATQTIDATATLAGDVITIVIPQPTLPQPGSDETATGFSHEYQYVISYTTCTSSGGMDAVGTEYGNSAVAEGQEYGTSVIQHSRSASGTGTGVSSGSVSIAKGLADTPGAEFVAAGTFFTVHVKEFAPGIAEPYAEYDLQVPLNGDAVNGLNPRGKGWTIELSEPTFPEVPGVTFGAPKFAESEGVTVSEDGTVATAAITPRSNVSVSLENTAQLGSLEVTKALTGPAADQVDPDREYELTAHIDTSALGDGVPAQDDRTFTLKAGETKALDNLPIGAIVTITEKQPLDDDIFTWQPYTVAPEAITVTEEHVTEPATFTVTNTVDRTYGTFTISKDVTGDQADNEAVPSEITVTATWNEEGTPGSKELTIPTDGTPVAFGEELLVGTKVTLVETPLEDGSSIAWGAPVWTGTAVEIDDEGNAVVTVTRNADAAVNVENHAATSVAGISILKGVAGEAAGEVPEGTEFPVTATWVDADGVTQSRDLLINATTPTELGEDLPAGTVVTITEGERPGFDTVVWGSIVISGDDVTDAGDGSAQVVVSDQQSDVTLVTILNEATWAPGSFSIAKNIEGLPLDDPEAPETVTVVATWTDEDGVEQSQELALPTDGTVVPFDGELPHGTEVTLTEVAQADTDRFAWESPAWAGDTLVEGEADSAIITIGAATVVEVSLTNAVTAKLGSIELGKDLTGSGADHVADGTVFPVTLEWVDLFGEPQTREVEITAGVVTVLEDLPLGTEIRITEGEADLADDTLRWKGVTFTTDSEQVTLDADDTTAVAVITGETGTAVSITLTNEIEKLPDLATSGGEAMSWIVLSAGALLLVAAGAFLVICRRRMS